MTGISTPTFLDIKLKPNTNVIHTDIQTYRHTDREELVSKLGGKCISCGTTAYQVLVIDHIFGQGYLEQEYFKNKNEMYRQYLQDFDYESQFIQILCYNCNVRKRQNYKEHARRPKLTRFPLLKKSIAELTENPALLVEAILNYPVLRQLIARQTHLWCNIIQSERQRRSKDGN